MFHSVFKPQGYGGNVTAILAIAHILYAVAVELCNLFVNLALLACMLIPVFYSVFMLAG